MKFSLDDRGVSEVLGAILVFGLLISVLTIIQVSGVPALNQQVEFEHNARVQDDIRAFASSVDSAAATGRDQPVDVETGVRYPPRLFLINPGPTAGTLSTTGPSEITFGNLEALDPEAGDYVNSANGPAPYTTTGLVYQPNYNQYTAAPETHYEHGIIYNVDGDGGVSVMDRGSIVSGKRISLTTLDGSLATSGGDSVSLTVVPVSAPTQIVPVRGGSSDYMTMTLPTALEQSTWDDLLAEQRTTNGGHVSDVAVSNGKVTITFEPGVTYELRVAKVAVSSGVSDEPPVYLTKVGPASPTIQPGGTDLTVELRDQYNTPIAGKEIEFRRTAGAVAFPNGKTGTTDADGRVTVTVVPKGNKPLSVEAWYEANGNGNPDDGDAFTVVYDSLAIADNTGGATGDLKEINSRTQAVVLESVAIQNKNLLNVTLKNNGTQTWNITEARISFVLATDNPTKADVTRTDGKSPAVVGTLPVRGGFVDIADIELTGGDTVDLQFDFVGGNLVQPTNGNGKPFDPLVVVTFIIEDGQGDEVPVTFFLTD